jgi:hypothetical protein|eukprot:SAG25_NODE_1099_length_4001_cov_10.883137_2_plen_60_part_00
MTSHHPRDGVRGCGGRRQRKEQRGVGYRRQQRLQWPKPRGFCVLRVAEHGVAQWALAMN